MRPERVTTGTGCFGLDRTRLGRGGGAGGGATGIGAMTGSSGTPQAISVPPLEQTALPLEEG